MSEPTLKDVLQAIAKLDAKVDRKADELRSEIGGLRAEMIQRFDELDAELTLTPRCTGRSKTTLRH